MRIIGCIIGGITLLVLAIGIGAPIYIFGTNVIYSVFLDNNFLCLLSCLGGIVILGLLFYIRKLFLRPQY